MRRTSRRCQGVLAAAGSCLGAAGQVEGALLEGASPPKISQRCQVLTLCLVVAKYDALLGLVEHPIMLECHPHQKFFSSVCGVHSCVSDASDDVCKLCHETHAFIQLLHTGSTGAMLGCIA